MDGNNDLPPMNPMYRRAFVGLAAAAAVSTLFQPTAVTLPAYMALAKDLMAGG